MGDAHAGINPRATVILFVITLLATTAASVASAQLHGSPRIGIDDANIFFVYARHLADGHGFVYNVGGERVEGFTSMLWVLVCAVFFAFSEAPEMLILGLCTVFVAVANAWILFFLLRREETSRTRQAVLGVGYLALLFSSPAYVTWTTITLMDVCLWGLVLALGAVALLQRAHLMLAGVVVLMLLTRPESLAVVPVVLVLLVLRNPKNWRSVLAPTIAFLTTVIALTAFRLLYFGYPLPNTYYAKVSPSLAENLGPGLKYLGTFLVGSPVALVSAILVVLVVAQDLLQRIRQKDVSALSPTILCALFCAALLVLPVLSGGDHFPMSRFYQGAYPLLLLFLFVALNEYRLRTHLAVTAVALLTLVNATFSADSWHGLARQPLAERPLVNEFEIAEKGRRVGRAFQQAFQENSTTLPSLGVITAGGVKMEYSGEVVDLMGLNNTRMGHSPGDRRGIKNHVAFNPEIFFELRPDVILPNALPYSADQTPGKMTGFQAMALHRLDRNPEFQEAYVYVEIEKKISGFFNRSFLDNAQLASTSATASSW